MNNNKPNVFIVCTGVGHINRGYESFTKECFAALEGNDSFNIMMLKGAGQSVGNQIQISCVLRNSRLAFFLSKITRKEIYWNEQATFLLGMLPSLIKYKPAVIFYSDFILGTFLWHLRSFLNLKYKLLFSNGAPNGPPYSTMDHVQQLLPMYVEMGKVGGTPEDKQTLLQYAVNIDLDNNVKKVANHRYFREKLQLPLDKKIIISVGAVNAYHKRMDYVVSEFATIDQDIYFLLVLGQIDDRSEPIIRAAANTINADNYLIKQVNGDEVGNYMAASDYFILASLSEGLPRVLPEALSNGLIPIVHDYDVTRQTLNQFGIFKDLRKPGMLIEALTDVDFKNQSKADVIKYAWENYSWNKLKTRYKTMIEKLI